MSVQGNTEPGRARPADVVGLGVAFAAAGLYFVLAGIDILPFPGGTQTPGAIIVCAGLAFLFAGLTCFVRAKAGMTDSQDDVPATAPLWLALSYRAFGIGVAGALALIGTWIAIGTGPRAFNISGPIGEMHTTGEVIGRSVFALGAVIVWIYVLVLTVGTLRKLIDRRRG